MSNYSFLVQLFPSNFLLTYLTMYSASSWETFKAVLTVLDRVRLISSLMQIKFYPSENELLFLLRYLMLYYYVNVVECVYWGFEFEFVSINMFIVYFLIIFFDWFLIVLMCICCFKCWSSLSLWKYCNLWNVPYYRW
jgi:hypothetical protein